MTGEPRRMNSLNCDRYALSWIAVALLTGCGASQVIGAPGASRESNAMSTHLGRDRSWIAPDAKRGDLLYVSGSGTNKVYVYTFPRGKLVGTLTGFSSPLGDCVDASQNVWVVNAGTKQILEYAHGGTSPIATLTDPTKHAPFACAVDPTTGNLAVTTVRRPHGNGGVLIYPDAQGLPQRYLVPHVRHIAYDGYDDQGNLFVDGTTGGRHSEPAFAELPQGGQSFETLSVYGGAFYLRPGGVQWDGKHITVVNVNVIYRLTISGSRAMVVGSTKLKEVGGSSVGGDVTPDWIGAGSTVAADHSYASRHWRVALWKYPRGGLPSKYFGGQFSGGTYGVTVSHAAR